MATKKKPLVSQKTGCSFKCRAHLVVSANEEQWELTVMDATHNHEPSGPVAITNIVSFPLQSDNI